MAIYYCMIAWIAVIYMISKGSPDVAYAVTSRGYKIKQSWAFLTMSFIVFFVGLRNSVGDTQAYITIYNNLPTYISADFFEKYTKDRGFFVLSALFKRFISTDYHWWFLLISVICGFAIVKTLAEYSENFFFSMFLFIAMAQFVWMMNGMRQFIAVSIIFMNLKLLKERKMVKYIILTLLLSMIHITALIMIPAYFIGTAKPLGRRFWIAIVIMLLAGMSMDYIADQFSYVVEDSAYEGYLTAAATTVGSNILRTVVAASSPALALFCYRYVSSENDPVTNISVNFSFVSAVLYFCSAQSGGILIGRLPIYFDVYNMLLLPWLIEHSFNQDSKRVLYIILIICYLLFFYYKIKIGMGMGYSSDILGISIR